MNDMERQSLAFRIFVYGVAGVLAILLLAPFLWLLLMSVSSTKDLTTIPLNWIPEQFDFSRYVQLLTVAIVLRMIEAFKVFDIIWVMTRGGPANSTKTVSILVYQEAFSFQRAGTGASIALIVVLISAVLISAYVAILRRQSERR